MEDKVIQHSFIFKISDKMTAQIKKPVTHQERKVWQSVNVQKKTRGFNPLAPLPYIVR